MSEKHIIQTPSLFKVDDSFKDERFMKVRIAVMHSGKNLNQSKFSTEVIKAAKDSFANIPILANIIVTTDEEGNQHMDYGSHDMHIEDDFFDSGNQRIIYDEKVVGVVPEHNNFEIIQDEETENDYVWVDALIYRDYGNYCADILESRGGTTSVSAEISCEEISYDSKDKALQVDKMTMCAITLLGEDVKPGMTKAHATVFTIDEDSRQKQIIDIIQELKQSLDNYIATYSSGINNHRKEETMKKEFDEQAEEEIKDTPSMENFDGDGEPEGGDDPEGTDYYEEPEGENNPEPEDNSESLTADSDPEDDDSDDDDSANDDSSDDDSGDDEPEGIPLGQRDDDDTAGGSKKKYSVEVTSDDKVHQFAVSLQAKIEALYTLVNDTYAEQDGVMYDCEVFDDDKYVIMSSWWTNDAYKQSYKVKKDVYSLVGDRVPVKAIWCTEDEQKALENMRANYSSIEEKLSQYESEPEKIEVLESEEYAQIRETDAYKELANRDTYFSMSKDELAQKLDACLLEYAKHNKIEFSAIEPKQVVSVKLFGNLSKKGSEITQGRYGGIFKKK